MEIIQQIDHFYAQPSKACVDVNMLVQRVVRQTFILCQEGVSWSIWIQSILIATCANN